MNFITKNLGWILLLGFFIFMLFIISSNDIQRLNNTGTGITEVESTLSGETDKNLNELMKLIDDEEVQELDDIEEADGDSNSKDEELVEQDETDVSENNEEELGFFARLFGRDNDLDQEDEDTTQSGIISSDTISEPEMEENMPIVVKEDDPDMDLSTNNVTDNSDYSVSIMKSSDSIAVEKYIDVDSNFPGTNLETEIGKKYQIGVQMLNLNNKSFTQKIGLMYQGDIVTQLTPENEFGCFQVQVSSTRNTGYVCKKYLASTDTSDSENSTTSIVNEEVPLVTTTPIVTQKEAIPAFTSQTGTYYKIAIENTSFFDVILERFTLDKGDILRQVSSVNPDTGCASMKVVGTSNGVHDGKIVDICSPDMVSSYNY